MAKRGGRGVGKPKAARRKARKRAAMLETRRREVFTYQGRARRSLERGPTDQQEKLLQKLKSTDGVVRTHRRDMVILPSFVGRTIAVHNGREFREITIAPEMIGHFLGELALTRKYVTHSGVGVGATRSSKFMPLK